MSTKVNWVETTPGKRWDAQNGWVTIIERYGIFDLYVMGGICEGASDDEYPHEDFKSLEDAKDWVEINWGRI